MVNQSFGKYLVTQSLDRGATAEVFRAHDPVLNHDVAMEGSCEFLTAAYNPLICSASYY